nr:hypothetical protein [uncultured Flavobacterium sp.]
MTLYRKNLYFVFISLLLTVCYILYGYFFRNFITQPDLPKEYLTYKYLDSKPASDHFEIIKLADDLLNFNNFYFSPMSETVVIQSNKNGFSYDRDPLRLYYKFNIQGKLIDSLIVDRFDYYKVRKKYLISEDHYISWIIDNDTTRHDYTELNPKADWDADRTFEEFERLSKKASSVYFFKSVFKKYNGDTEAFFDKAIFLIDQKWYAIYGKKIYVYPEPEEQSEKDKKTILPVYTQKLSQHGDNLSQVDAYYNLIIKNDTLKIKREVWSDRSDLVYYCSPANPEFCIIEGTNFIIKPKK